MPTRFLIASIGNPAPYGNTLHSAGHVLLDSLRAYLSLPPLSRDPSFSGAVSRGELCVLFQSPSYMNTSGVAVSKAYKAFLRELPSDERTSAKLVVLHDELELPLGKIKLKVGGSARGHNGIKSCVEKLGGAPFVRIGVGVGRPASRESGDVAAYVLKKLKEEERQKIEAAASDTAALLEKVAGE